MTDDTTASATVEDAVTAHGGRDRWSDTTSLNAPLSIGGSLGADKGHDGVLADAAVWIDPHHQRVRFSGFGPRRLSTWFEPGLVTLHTGDGAEITRRSDPRGSFPRDATDPWDDIQVAYFASYAIWNYLTLPFLLASPGIKVSDEAPWPDADPTWTRVSADFGHASFETHNRLQHYNFGLHHLLMRHDYDADVLGSPPASNQACDYREFGGLMFPICRRVTARSADGAAATGPILVSIDFGEITVK